MKEVKFDKEALSFLVELADTLVDKDYFSFYDFADTYTVDLVDYIVENIQFEPHIVAPEYFSKYGHNLFFIRYKRNHQTTWYIFFEKTTQHFLIRYISNNHVIGKYL